MKNDSVFHRSPNARLTSFAVFLGHDFRIIGNQVPIGRDDRPMIWSYVLAFNCNLFTSRHGDRQVIQKSLGIDSGALVSMDSFYALIPAGARGFALTAGMPKE